MLFAKYLSTQVSQEKICAEKDITTIFRGRLQFLLRGLSGFKLEMQTRLSDKKANQNKIAKNVNLVDHHLYTPQQCKACYYFIQRNPNVVTLKYSCVDKFRQLD